MRRYLRLVLLSTATVFVAATAAPAQTCDPNSISIAEYGRMKEPVETIVLIVPAKLSRECLLAFGKSLHEQKLSGRYEFFDARDVNLGLYISCNNKETDSELACERYSLKWIEKHEIGSLNVDTDLSSDGCPHWALFDNKHHSIMKFERVSWCPYKE